jgi:hypothetical protein
VCEMTRSECSLRECTTPMGKISADTIASKQKRERSGRAFAGIDDVKVNTANRFSR